MPFNRKNHNILGEIRPRFRLKTDLEPDVVFEAIQEKLNSDDTVKGYVTERYAVISVAPADLHYWSPELQIRVDQDDDHEDGAEVRCLVGPRQSVWAMFAFFYALVGLITFFGGFYGLVQEDMGESSDFIWCLPVGILLLIGIWVAAKVGQNTGRDQMLHLVSVLYHGLSEKGEVERVS